MKKLVYLVLFTGLLYSGCAKKAGLGNSPVTGNKSGKEEPRRGEILFLGHNNKHHDSGKYAPWLAITLFKSGLNLTYTTNLKDLNPENLSKYDGLVIYANHDTLAADQEKALQGFVEGGKGLIPLHCATGCFKNSDWYINAIGGQFKSHGNGTFTAAIVNKKHPVTQGLTEFSTTDETYVHQNLNKDKTVLMERVEGSTREPYTWVRNQGKGRVFYTAYGHDDSTWTKPGFQKLVSNGVLWAIGDKVQKQIAQFNAPNVDIYASSNIAISDYTKRHLVPKMQEALTPEQSLKLTQVPVDFDVQLFAAEPDITNPIAMSWDERGRLWIVESVDYPNTFLETDGAANDRIKICEDTNSDGKADKFTVFADKLNIPTSMVFANGGVVVSMAPYFVFLKDTNGDDKADVRENIMTGWEKNDTHFGPSNLQYGFDNKIWGVVGSGFNGTTKDSKNLSFRTGVYHVNPDGTGMEFLANTSNNTWGLGFSEDNHVFISTANNTHSAFYSMPAKYTQRALPTLTASADKSAPTGILPVQKIDGHYDAHSLTPNLRQVDVVGGFTSAAGHHLYTARSFPKEYWNRIALVCEPTVRLLHNAVIEPKGAGFAEKDGWNLMASSDEWFGPVHAEVGPDGAVWVADWYNFIIQHNVFVPAQAPSEMVLPFTEQPMGQGNAFSSPLRDINHGRVYRVVYKKAKPYSPLKLSKNDTPTLLAALENDNMFWRMTAQRLLVEAKDKATLPGLYKIINNQKVDEIGLNSPAVHALWTLHGMGVLNGTNAEAMQVAVKALNHPAAGVRKAALAVMPKNAQAVDILKKTSLLNDPNLNVRLNTLLALAELPASAELGKLVYETTLKPENAQDEWISRAAFAAAIAHQDGFMAAAGKTNTESNTPDNLSARIAKALSEESYALPRRGNLLLPPDVSNKEITMKGSVSKGKRDLEGMLVAQGGPDNGYGLFIQNNKLHLLVNQKGKSYTATSKESVPEKFDFKAQLLRGGEMTLVVNDQTVAQGKAPSLFAQPLTTTVRVSQDVENTERVGKYDGPFRLVGDMQNATLELRPAGKSVSTKPVTGKPVVKTTPVKKATSASQASETITINLRVVENVMQFDKKLLTVKAGQKVVINLMNPDNMQHNLVIIQKNMMQKVGAAADVMARDPNGAEKSYVPQIPEVLHATKLVNSGEEVTLEFTAPAQAGDYPFVCTFPGHWRIMNGILKVVN